MQLSEDSKVSIIYAISHKTHYKMEVCFLQHLPSSVQIWRGINIDLERSGKVKGLWHSWSFKKMPPDRFMVIASQSNPMTSI